jgi:hypothetical protein
MQPGQGRQTNAHRIFMGNIFGKRSLGKTRRRWQDNIKFDVRKVSYEDGKWMELLQDCIQWQALVLVLNHQIVIPINNKK